VSLQDAMGFEGNTLANFAAPFQTSGPWGPAWSAALARLASAKPDEGGMGGIIGGLAGGKVRAHPESLSFSTRFARAEDDPNSSAKLDGALQLPDGLAPLRACFGQERGSAELLIEVDGSGRVARCEAREIDDALATCACRAMGQAVARPSLRGKRAFVSVSFQPADTVSAGLEVVEVYSTTYLQSYRASNGETLWRPDVSDPSISAWRPPGDHALATCFAAETAPGHFTAGVTVTFDAQGRASEARVAASKGAAWSQERLACVWRAFLTAGAPCPAAPGARAAARVEISLKRIGSN
jgi:hypothetical protein